MLPADRREQLAHQIDTHVKQTIADGGGDEELLTSMYDYICCSRKSWRPPAAVKWTLCA